MTSCISAGDPPIVAMFHMSQEISSCFQIYKDEQEFLLRHERDIGAKSEASGGQEAGKLEGDQAREAARAHTSSEHPIRSRPARPALAAIGRSRIEEVPRTV